MEKIIDGKKSADEIVQDLAMEINKLDRKPGLAAVVVGDNPASHLYVGMKEKKCREAGIYSERHNLAGSASEAELLKLIEKLNTDPKIHAILMQMPLPKQIRSEKIIEKIASEKDVDCFKPENIGNLIAGNETIAPCTPKGIMHLLEKYKVQTKGKNATVIGRSMIVGKPSAIMLTNRDATVTLCHSKTENLAEHTKNADIIIVAAGTAKLLKGDMIKKGCTIIDVGTNKLEGKLAGDVDFEECKKVAGLITPVPGGVGPMTIAMLLKNTLECYKQQNDDI